MRTVSLLASVGVILALLAWVVLYSGALDWMFAFQVRVRITNMSGNAVAVISTHTKERRNIPNGACALIPHADGDIVIEHRNGMAWVYKSVSPTKCDYRYRTITKYYIPFGGGTWTVDYLLDSDGHLYIVSPDVEDVSKVDGTSMRQPTGYPLIPQEEEWP